MFVDYCDIVGYFFFLGGGLDWLSMENDEDLLLELL